jgi:hypothetical protein
LLRSASEKHPLGLANGSDVVGRHYMGHVNSVLMALSKCPNPTVFQKTLALNDFYFGSDDWDFPMGDISFVGKLDAVTLSAGAPAIAPGWTLDLMAKHSLDFWLTSEDLPDPDNRVTVDRDGRIRLAYTPNNEEGHKRLIAKLEHLMNRQGACAEHGHACHAGLLTRVSGSLCPCRNETPDAADRLVEDRVLLCQRDADMACGSRTEAFARHHCNAFGIEQAEGEAFTVGIDGAHIEHPVHAALGTAQNHAVRPVESGAEPFQSGCVAGRDLVDAPAFLQRTGNAVADKIRQAVGARQVEIRQAFDDVLRTAQPADPPAGHPVALRHRIDDQGALLHTGQRQWRDVAAAGVAPVYFVRNKPDVMRLAEIGNRLDRFPRVHRTRGVVRRIDQ